MRFVFGLACAALLAACGGTTSTEPVPVTPPRDTTPPAIAREMRGLWIATVANIDWPSRNSLTADQQRAELIDILDRASAAGFNAIIFHVRPAGDALYDSALEPWGAMLTGTQGTSPGYDPLAFAIEQAHARGMELHAWINPFRAGNRADSLKLAPTHFFRARRDVSVVYGTQLWFDPGQPDVQDHSMEVVADIVRRYDIDAIHADDYFYPYQENDAQGRAIDFPDSASYAKFGGDLSRADWRRANIDRFVERMYREVHAIKPTVKVGLSPFGIWRPGFPPGITGLDAFASIYADSRKWLQQGWVDYLAPQLYWSIASAGQSYPALLDWWIAQISAQLPRYVWPGLAAYRVSDGTASAFSANEIADQIRLTRTRPLGTGHILYNTTSTLKRASGPVVNSVAPLYLNRAIVPAMPWLDVLPPSAPTITVSGRTVQVSPGPGEAARWWVVRWRTSSGWTTRVVFGDQRSITLDTSPERVLVNAVDRAGNLSPDASTP
ncbi:MAG TPA: family 10 glycosylhydrolase [Gemmatimonadaceae bacterium]